ncbi:hypothetical protein CTM_12555 [Clostridium tetanomorphum DSM 665]|nr:hypothetical protein CTM_12555 [Clostridium tetanomorphum DSM 665]
MQEAKHTKSLDGLKFCLTIFYCVPSMGNNLTVKVRCWEPLADGKGVHREVESEGSRRQNLGLRNTNYI